VATEPDQDELDLERLLFGDNTSSLISTNDGEHGVPADESSTISSHPGVNVEDDVDSNGTNEDGAPEAVKEAKTLWHDDDDDELEVDIASSSRLRKLRSSKVCVFDVAMHVPPLQVTSPPLPHSPTPPPFPLAG
jgi:hypothetical protein